VSKLEKLFKAGWPRKPKTPAAPHEQTELFPHGVLPTTEFDIARTIERKLNDKLKRKEKP
jgi:hypothetical protein